MDLETVADELYATAPEDFVAVREERVRQARSAGERDLAGQIHRLRKPMMGAWVVNLLARELSEDVDRLLELGEQLREAQHELRGDELRTLSRQRTQVVSALARQGRRLAGDTGHRVSEAVEREVEGTLEAALADPDAAGAVRSGQLVRPLSYSGFGGVDLSDAVARPRPAPGGRPRRPAPRRTDARTETDEGPEAAQRAREQAQEQAREQAERELAEAEDEARQADEEEARAREREDGARARREAADERIAALETELDRAKEEAADAGRDLQQVSRDAQRAGKRTASAWQHVEHARRRLDSSPR